MIYVEMAIVHYHELLKFSTMMCAESSHLLLGVRSCYHTLQSFLHSYICPVLRCNLSSVQVLDGILGSAQCLLLLHWMLQCSSVGILGEIVLVIACVVWCV